MDATMQELLTEIRDLAVELECAAANAAEYGAEDASEQLAAVSITLASLADRYAAENRRQWSKHYAEIAAA